MKKLYKAIGHMRAALVIILAFLLSFQAFAYMPPIISHILPETVVGMDYRYQLVAEEIGFSVVGKAAVWSAEGLPVGLEIDPVNGVIFGAAKKAGMFEVLVTVRSRRLWRPKIDSKRFLLYVSPLVKLPEISPPSVPDVPPLPQQNSAPQISAETPAPTAAQNVLQWLRLEANGTSGAQSTTEFYLIFSGVAHISNNDLDTFILITGGKATPVSFSLIGNTDGEYRYALAVNLSENVMDKEIITVTLESVPYLEPDPMSMQVEVYVATDASIAGLALDALTTELLLGENTSADEITSDLTLPFINAEYECDIAWSSQYPEIISNTGAVTRPEFSEGDRDVTLTARAVRGIAAPEKAFPFTVLAKEQEPVPAPPENKTEVPAPILPAVVSSEQAASREKPNSDATRAAVSAEIRTSTNVSKNGSLSRTSIIGELQAALQDTEKRTAVVRTQNAQTVSPKTLKALAAAAEAEGRQAVIYADTVTQARKVDARLYLTTASIPSITEPIKLGIATKGERPEAVKRFFEKHFDNSVSVISCEQQGSFGAKLQIAAKIKLPEDTAKLTFYSYNAETNTFSRILTAYRIDANGYLRFATETAGDIIVSNGPLKKR